MNNGSLNHSQPAILKGMAGILDLLTRASYVLSGLALTGMVSLILYEVSMRYFFNAPTNWSSDVNQWLFALTVMLALPEITRANGNVAITIVIEKLPQQRKLLIYRGIAFLGFLVCIAVFIIAGLESFRQFQRGIATMWVNPIPKWWISSVIPLGFLLSGFQFLREGFKPNPPGEV